MSILRTPRLLLIAATEELLEAELTSREALGAALQGEVPESWPPELYDADAVRWTRERLASHPEDGAWSLYYILEEGSGFDLGRRLAGIAGYKGAPDENGIVEIGYGIVTEATAWLRERSRARARRTSFRRRPCSDRHRPHLSRSRAVDRRVAQHRLRLRRSGKQPPRADRDSLCAAAGALCSTRRGGHRLCRRGAGGAHAAAFDLTIRLK